jgi:hypothetical protein
MPQRPDFYCFFYCAAWDGQRQAVPERYGTALGPAVAGQLCSSGGSPRMGLPGRFGRSLGLLGEPGLMEVSTSGGGRPSGTRRVPSMAQRLSSVGRPGAVAAFCCSTSLVGSIRRGR